jgi:hypothetical protein
MIWFYTNSNTIESTCPIFTPFKMPLVGQAWWYASVIPDTQEKESRGIMVPGSSWATSA